MGGDALRRCLLLAEGGEPGRLLHSASRGQEHATFTEVKAPYLLAFNLYLSGDGRRVSAVQLRPTARTGRAQFHDAQGVVMVEPFIFVQTAPIKDGHAGQLQKGRRGDGYINEEGTEQTVIQVHPDSESTWTSRGCASMSTARPPNPSWR